MNPTEIQYLPIREPPVPTQATCANTPGESGCNGHDSLEAQLNKLAKSMELTHEPKQIYCDVCNKAKTQGKQ